AGVVLPVSALVPLARWITPEIEIKRYDVLFFAAAMPADQQAVHQGGETTDGVWMTPRAAIAAARDDRLALPPPTWTMLRTLERFASIDDVLAWARGQR